MKHSIRAFSTGLLNAGNLRGLAITLCLAAFSGSVLAADYYRWQDADGVVHYGSHPPKGVEAVKIKTYGGKSTTPVATTSNNSSPEEAATEAIDEANLPPEEVARRRNVAEKQKQMCDDERKRLETLSRPGRIRMKQPDGSFRYMTQEEIGQEIATTKSVLNDSCK